MSRWPDGSAASNPLDVGRHADDLVAAAAEDRDGRTWTYLPYGPFPTAEEHRAWLEAASTSEDPLFFAILDAATGGAVGVASYLRFAPEVGSIEVGHLYFSPCSSVARPPQRP